MRCKIANLAAAAIIIGGAQIASAAELAVKARPFAVPVAVYNWTGCYIGANGGWVGSRNTYDLAPSGSYLTPPGGAAPPNAAGTGDFPASIAALSHSYTSRDSGGLVGAQIGCNYQVGQFVFGGEADWQWTSLSDSISAAYAAFANPGNPAFTNAAHTETISNDLRWFGTLRARGGIAFDRLFLYATGGLAVANIQSSTNVTFGTVALNPVYNGATHIGSSTWTRAGWVIGAGAEYAFTSNWSFKAEYLYMNFGTHNYLSPLVAATAPAVVGPGYSWSTTVTEHIHVARVGINYKF
jgi:outer membrane immunogenic protein